MLQNLITKKPCPKIVRSTGCGFIFNSPEPNHLDYEMATSSYAKLKS